jgi:hypothetical protein
VKVIFGALMCASLLAAPLATRAGFFIPKDTTMLMGMHSPDAQSLELAHGLTRDWSLMGGYHRYRSDDLGKDRRFTAVQLSYLLNRTYQSDGVGNLYVFGGPIVAQSKSELDESKPGWQAGAWGDYETRRIYTRVSIQTHDAGPLRQTVTTGQALWAPYAADYEDIASWIGVQLQRRSHLSDVTQVTPMLRFFQRNWWVDAGISANDEHRGDVFINLMLLF